MLPRFNAGIEREFHDAKSFEHLRAGLPILRVPLNFVPRSIAGMYGAVAMKGSCVTSPTIVKLHELIELGGP